MRLFFKEDQVTCFDCGEQFLPDKVPTKSHPITSVTCPNGCKGSWASINPDTEYRISKEI
jgi:hypothetical protein